jgi:hypothetical protein
MNARLDARMALYSELIAFDHYNELHLHAARRYRVLQEVCSKGRSSMPVFNFNGLSTFSKTKGVIVSSSSGFLIDRFPFRREQV